MDATQQPVEPEIYMPTEAATATAPNGRRMVFFTVPQLDLLIKRVLASRPREYTYQWGYHPQQQVHVMLFEWPEVGAGGIAIPEGVGDAILHYMSGTTDVYITVEPVQERLAGAVDPLVVEKIVMGNTVHLPEVQFRPQA